MNKRTGGKSRQRLQCFVAMVIRRGSDADQTYFKIIKPLLQKGLDARVFRIDEVRHNENIDMRILKEIEKADFVLADLTYARPSVYFEAGYAIARGKPVVFSCREDHLSRKAEYEVHFDLRQRTIIPWATPGDRRFPRRLLAQTRALIRPVQERQLADEKLAEQRGRFEKLAPTERIGRLRQEVRNMSRRAGFADAEPGADLGGSTWRGYRRRKRGLETLYVLTLRSAVKGAVKDFAHFGFRRRTVGSGPANRRRALESMALRRHLDHLAVVALGGIPVSRVESVLPDFTRRTEGTWSKVGEPLYGEPKEHQMSFHVVDEVRSPEEFVKRYGMLLAAL